MSTVRTVLHSTDDDSTLVLPTVKVCMCVCIVCDVLGVVGNHNEGVHKTIKETVNKILFDLCMTIAKQSESQT